MDLNRLIQMLVRMFIRKAVDTGVDRLARRGKPDAELTPQERKQKEAAKALADRAKQFARIGRRFRG